MGDATLTDETEKEWGIHLEVRPFLTIHISPEEHKRMEEERLKSLKILEREYDEFVKNVESDLPRIPTLYHPIYRDIPDDFEGRWEYVRSNPLSSLASSIVCVKGSSALFRCDLAREYVRMLGGTPMRDLTRRVDFYVRLGDVFESRDEDDKKISKWRSEGCPMQVLDEFGFVELIKRSIADNGGSDNGESYIPRPNFFVPFSDADIPYEYESVIRTDEQVMADVRAEYMALEQLRHDALGGIRTPDAPATYKQISLLKNHRVPFDPSITMGEAKALIDATLISDLFKREKEFNDRIKALSSEERLWELESLRRYKRKLLMQRKTQVKEELEKRAKRERKLIKTAMKAAREKWSQYVMCEEVKTVCKENKRITKDDGVLHQWREEFVKLWNDVLEDDVFDMFEVDQLRNWLLKHMRKTTDYRNMFCVLEVAQDDITHTGTVRQSIRELLFSSAIACLKTLGSTNYDEET